MRRTPTFAAIAASLLLAGAPAAAQDTPAAPATPHTMRHDVSMQHMQGMDSCPCCAAAQPAEAGQGCCSTASHERVAAQLRREADAQEARAERHRLMARTVSGNPNRGAGIPLAAHCETIAERADSTARALREMADAHTAH